MALIENEKARSRAKVRESNFSNKLIDAYYSFENVSYDFIKRTFDIIIGLMGVALLIPTTVIVKMISLACGDYDSIFYTQKRIGKNGKEFKLYKYRSMQKDADVVLEKLLKDNPDLAHEYKVNKKLEYDPRITKVGRLIRTFSIDELPQFINVLKGEMSIVGNRPYLPKEKDDMGYGFDLITSTKPGMTGYWQVSGRNDVSFRKRLELEEYYSNNYTIELDTYIFFKTFLIVFFRKGAK